MDTGTTVRGLDDVEETHFGAWDPKAEAWRVVNTAEMKPLRVSGSTG